MGFTWVLSAPDGPHVGPMNLAIWLSGKGDSWDALFYLRLHDADVLTPNMRQAVITHHADSSMIKEKPSDTGII